VASAARSPRPWTGVWTVLACAGLAAVLYPYSYGLHNNHSLQIALVNLLHDPTLYPGDPFMATMDGYATFFWPIAAWVTRWLPIEPTFFVGHLFTLVATYSAIYEIARAIDREDPWAPHLACWMYLWWSQDLGGESLHWFYWAHTPVATAVGFWAIVLALRKRWLWAFAAAGVAFDVQAMQGLYLVGAFSAARLLERRRISGELIAGWVLWIVAAAPTFVLIARSSGGEGAADMGEILRAFFPAHFYASTFPAEEWLAIIAAVLMFAVSALATWREPVAMRVILLGGALLAFMVVGGAATELTQLGVLLKLHVFRASSFFVTLALCLTAVAASRLVKARSRSNAQLLLGIGFVLALATLGPIFPYLADGKRVVLLAVLVLGGLAAVSLWRPNAAALAAGIAVAGVLGAWLCWGRLENPYAYFGELNIYEQAGDWERVQRWARENTMPADRFLTPPYLEGFRVFSERPVVGEWKDAAAVMWSREYTDYWRTWYTRMGGTFERRYDQPIWKRLEASWSALPLGEVERIARDYDADYILFRRDDYERIGWGGELLYDGPLFVVVARR